MCVIYICGVQSPHLPAHRLAKRPINEIENNWESRSKTCSIPFGRRYIGFSLYFAYSCSSATHQSSPDALSESGPHIQFSTWYDPVYGSHTTKHTGENIYFFLGGCCGCWWVGFPRVAPTKWVSSPHLTAHLHCKNTHNHMWCTAHMPTFQANITLAALLKVNDSRDTFPAPNRTTQNNDLVRSQTVWLGQPIDATRARSLDRAAPIWNSHIPSKSQHSLVTCARGGNNIYV